MTSAVKDYFRDLSMIFNVLENEHGEPHLRVFGKGKVDLYLSS